MCHDGLLDTSNYSANHRLFSNARKAKLGCIKDESCGEQFADWILLRPKCYSMETTLQRSIKRAKGVQRCVVEKEIRHSDYQDVYFSHLPMKHTVSNFETRRHEIRTVTTTKRSLSLFDDKRYWITPNESVAFGHHHINKTKRMRYQ